jgi:hypothetical protein
MWIEVDKKYYNLNNAVSVHREMIKNKNKREISDWRDFYSIKIRFGYMINITIPCVSEEELDKMFETIKLFMKPVKLR